MIEPIEDQLECARREYDAREEQLRALPEFCDFIGKLRFSPPPQPPPALAENGDFRRWTELATLICELHRLRVGSDRPEQGHPSK